MKTGDWAKVRFVIGGLAKEMQIAREISVAQFAAKAEAVAKKHMSAQDLNWKPLKEATVAAKIRRGESENILIATSDYFQAITSWSDRHTAYAGVKKNIVNDDGEELANIAAIHEFGSEASNIDARPLWQPTYKEAFSWYEKNAAPDMIFYKRMQKRML